MTAPDDRTLSRLADADRLLVCCDFDGTLSHLVDDPGAARPVPGAVEVLDRLGTLPNTAAAVLSGRSLEALRAVSGLPPHVTAIGSHGVEFDAGEIEGLEAGERELLARVVAACEAIVRPVPGATVESKPASVAVHVRRADPEAGADALAAVRSGPAAWSGVHVTTGKDVIELAVVVVGKGRALSALRAGARATATLFMGDDVTDEDAFRVLETGDVGVKVGAGESLAQWRVPDPDAVVTVLAELAGRRADMLRTRVD